MEALEDRQVAVFLDVENLAIHAAQQGVSFRVGPIVDRAKNEGRVTVARAYGDFSRPFMRPVLDDLQRSVFELGQLPTDARGKNTADMLLALDALEMYLRPGAPGVIVIGSGDRDYVPLVQRLRRFGAHVIGVGLKGSISPMLRTICDGYWYYEDLIAPEVPPGLAETAQTTQDALGAALLLFRSVVIELEAAEEPCLLSRVKEVMSQRWPHFRYQEFGFKSFREFAEAAAGRRLVHVSTVRGTTVTVSARVVEEDAAEQSPEEAARRLCDQYRGVLEAKRVPLVPWQSRRRLIEALWAELEQTPEGLTIVETSDVLLLAALSQGIAVTEQAVYKMTYTLNLGRCFKTEAGPVFVDDIRNQKVRPACAATEALDRMNVTYLRGIHMDRPDLPLRPDAAALLLFDEANEAQVARASEYVRRVAEWIFY